MAIRIVRLGTPRAPGEVLRLGTVRYPPRGVPKNEYASRDFFDLWLPDLSPSAQLLKSAKSGNAESDWRRFVTRFRREMRQPEQSRLLDLLAAISHHAEFSLGCYCAQESRCHRSVLRALLQAREASIA